MSGPALPGDPAELFSPPAPVPHTGRERVVQLAMAELEHGDHTGRKYWLDVYGPPPHPRHWCGAFALWCLRAAGLCDWTWRASVGFLYVDDDGKRSATPRLPITTTPEPGDVAYYQAKQHYAIVSHIDGDNVVTIDGNQPDIRLRERKLGAAEAYFSIRELV